jgi:hypothetical protein
MRGRTDEAGIDFARCALLFARMNSRSPLIASSNLCRVLLHSLTFAVLMFPATHASAEVISAESNGLGVRHVLQIAATPDAVYAALVQPGRWWNPSHSYSGDASNLSLETRAGGCFCEKLSDGGSVQHLTVAMVKPGKELRMRGALGPFQTSGTEGAMTILLKGDGQRTELTLTYVLGGYISGGLTEWAPKVDAMLGDQVGRLKRLIETGSPQAR